MQAGLKLADLQAFLAPSGQFLPLDPSYADNATIGGIIATADAGTWRQRYGGVRDLILGFSFIRHDGEIAKAGGRVVKNVAGYDMMKLFTGSYGTLGIIDQITLRLYPETANSETLIITGNSDIKGANWWGKSKTVSQIIAIALLIAPLPSEYNLISQIAFWLSVTLTLISGVIYVTPSPKLTQNSQKLDH